MSRNITHFRVFIASAGGLDNIRKEFKETIDHYNQTEALHRELFFDPVGWEETIDGIGRPQAKINEELQTCDYSIFIFPDRWGSPPDLPSNYSSGTEEEYEIALKMYNNCKTACKTFQGLGEKSVEKFPPQVV